LKQQYKARSDKAMPKAEKQAIAKEVQSQLESLGYTVMYGGRKGHGFWIKGYVSAKPKSGNPHFQTMKECQAIIAAKVA
jgi:hypothetical protein